MNGIDIKIIIVAVVCIVLLILTMIDDYEKD